MKQFLVAIFLIAFILTASFGVSAFINSHCDSLEKEAVVFYLSAKEGNTATANAASQKFSKELTHMFSVLYFTANHHDLTTLEVAFRQLRSFIEDEEFADASVALITLRDSLRTLRMTEQVSLINIF